MVRLPPGSAYLGTDRPENTLPDEDPGVPPDMGALPPPPPPGVAPAPSMTPPLTGGYDDDPEIIAAMAEQYMGIPRAQLDAMPTDQYMQLLDQLEQGYPQDERLLGAISRVRPFLLHEDAGAGTSAMPLPPEDPLGGAPPGAAPPAGEPSFRPDRPY